MLIVGLVLFASMQAVAWAEPPSCDADMKPVEFFRDDLASLKKQMEGIVAAIGEPGAPYGRESGSWSYPRGVCKAAKGYVAVQLSYDTSFSTEGQQKKLELEYRKKMMAAQAAGNMQAMAQIAQEMQQKAVGQAMANEGKAPVNMSVDADSGAEGTIDPDSVLRDGVGFIAIRDAAGSDADSEQVDVYFDHIALKDAKRIANYSIPGEMLVSGPHDFGNLHVHLSGPRDVVDKMVKHMDAGKILGTLQSNYINREP
jgi:hypothetical protein